MLLVVTTSRADILVPMDLSQTDHLKAYGLAYKVLKAGVNVEWLLNYRGGSFLFAQNDAFLRQARLMGVSYELVDPGQAVAIHAQIEQENMEVVLLEKAPRVAIYTPPNKSPWDDAVTLALTYAEVDYDTIWDQEVLEGRLQEYDWLHLHHEDFTGQYNKFYIGYTGRDWYLDEVQRNEEMAERFGFAKVWQLKHAVAGRIAEYVRGGGFLFAMCLAAETLDIALSATDLDIVPADVDGDGYNANIQEALDFINALAFKNFSVELNPQINSFSNIDGHQVNNPPRRQPLGYFQLFKFAAKYDPVPSMLTQDHTDFIRDFYGQSTSFVRSMLKEAVTVLALEEGKPWVKYIHGNAGKGFWTFLGGHDPEDPEHRIGDLPTRLELHKNSPGYRLILNNLLFPAARKKELKT
ncbi:MAG TPA: asparagine synthetase B [Candidatus Glassbacteria bacterium]|nr:asparagine synthetase B [Candidatus Glassbacteria bacterium]